MVAPLDSAAMLGAMRILWLAGEQRPVIAGGEQGGAWSQPGGIAGLFDLMPGTDARALDSWRQGVAEAAVIVLGDRTPPLGFELRDALATGRPVIAPDTETYDGHLRALGATTPRYRLDDPISLAAALLEALRGERAGELARSAAVATADELWSRPAAVLFDALCASVDPERVPDETQRSPEATVVDGPTAAAEDRLHVVFLSPVPAFGGHATIIRKFLHALCRDPRCPFVSVVSAADSGPEGSLMREVLSEARPDRARLVPQHEVPGALAEAVEQADVVYSVWPHGVDAPSVSVALVTTFYDMNWRHFDHLRLEERLKLHAQTPGWLSAAQIVCSSEFVAGELGAFYGADVPAIPIIPTPAPTVLAPPSAAQADAVARRYGLPSRFLLCPAGHHPSKNYAALISACRLLRAQGAPVSVVATGIHTERLVGPDVVGLGYVDAADLRALFELCSGVVQPTLYEAGSFPMLEALSCRRPAAVSDIPAITEQIRRWDLRVETFDGRDPASCARAMQALIAGARSGDVEHNLQAVHGYTWADFAARYLDVFYAAAGRTAPGISAPIAA
jgi:glycosyltransferase involved in cell wall biosynthesis